MRQLPMAFYRRPVLQVAPELLGCIIVRTFRGRTVSGRIVEVEAYREDDPASHSYRGATARNEVMFGPGGSLYVYFTYGMHFCANVVTGVEGHGEAALIRGVEPLTGLDLMASRRYGRKRLRSPADVLSLCRGPARFCEAFHLSRPDNGIPLDSPEIFIAPLSTRPSGGVARSGRIGIRHATEKRWRFFERGSPWVSGPRHLTHFS